MLLIYYLANLAFDLGEKVRSFNLVQIQTESSPTHDNTRIHSTVKERITYNRAKLLGLRNHHDNKLLPCLLPFNTIRTVRSLRLNRKKCKTNVKPKFYQTARRGVNPNNLIRVPTGKESDDTVQIRHGISVSTINTRLVKNKDHILMDELKLNNSDCIVITETWLGSDDDDWVKQSCLTT